MKEYIAAKPTLYKGQLFVSRLKVRWAIFFDALPIKWVYKPRKYFPDFWLPQVNMWAEVRPLGFTEDDYEQAFNLIIESGYDLLMLIGDKGPKFRPYYALEKHTSGKVCKCISPYALSNYHNYPEEEQRFYFCCGDNLNEEGGDFSDTLCAIQIARNIDLDAQEIYEKDKLSKIEKWTYSLRDPTN